MKIIAEYEIKCGIILCFKSNIESKIKTMLKKSKIILIAISSCIKWTYKTSPINAVITSEYRQETFILDLQKKHFPLRMKKLIIGIFCHHKRFFLQCGQKDGS